MNDVLAALGHSAIWAGMRSYVHAHPSLALPAIVLGAVFLIWRSRRRRRR